MITTIYIPERAATAKANDRRTELDDTCAISIFNGISQFHNHERANTNGILIRNRTCAQPMLHRFSPISIRQANIGLEHFQQSTRHTAHYILYCHSQHFVCTSTGEIYGAIRRKAILLMLHTRWRGYQ